MHKFIFQGSNNMLLKFLYIIIFYQTLTLNVAERNGKCQETINTNIPINQGTVGNRPGVALKS